MIQIKVGETQSMYSLASPTVICDETCNLRYIAVEKPAAIQHEGRGGVAAIASASSASGRPNSNKSGKKSAKNPKSKINLSLSSESSPLPSSPLLLIAMWSLAWLL